MPLPTRAERAATKIAERLAVFDAAILRHVTDGGPLPDVDRAMRDIRPLVIEAVDAGIVEIDRTAGAVALRRARAGLAEQIEQTLRAAVTRGRRLRNEADIETDGPEDDEAWPAFLRRVGTFAAFLYLLSDAPDRADQVRVRRLARRAGVTLPRQTAAHSKMVVRTETAIRRNEHAVDVINANNRADVVDRPWVAFIRDARLGPTDEPCEFVDRKYATARWVERHPVEHPNCTRLARPVRLPQGATVTLLE